MFLRATNTQRLVRQRLSWLSTCATSCLKAAALLPLLSASALYAMPDNPNNLLVDLGVVIPHDRAFLNETLANVGPDGSAYVIVTDQLTEQFTLTKLAIDGQVQWSRTYDNVAYPLALDLAISPNNQIWIAAAPSPSRNEGPIVANILRLGATGDVESVTSLDSQFVEITATSGNQLAVLTTSSLEPPVLYRLDESAQIVFSTEISGNSALKGMSISADSDNGYWVGLATTDTDDSGTYIVQRYDDSDARMHSSSLSAFEGAADIHIAGIDSNTAWAAFETDVNDPGQSLAKLSADGEHRDIATYQALQPQNTTVSNLEVDSTGGVWVSLQGNNTSVGLSSFVQHFNSAGDLLFQHRFFSANAENASAENSLFPTSDIATSLSGDVWHANGNDLGSTTLYRITENSSQSAPVCTSTESTDGDGDGWSYDHFHSSSCRTIAGITMAHDCIDSDGDGFGWNGFETCTVDNNTATESDSLCVDYDGDGFGWNGSQSCLIDDTNTGNAMRCIDYAPIGDGFGWNGQSSCRL